MGLCVDCKYHSLDDSDRPPCPKVPKGPPFHHTLRPWLLPGFYDSEHKCLCPDNYEIDFVTGVSYFPSCYSKNRFEECPYWEEDEDGKMADKEEDTESTETSASTTDEEINP